VEDAAESHVVAISKAPEIGFDTFIISAKTPFQRGDCRQLITDAPAVVERYFPHYRELYARVGWTMFQRGRSRLRLRKSVEDLRFRMSLWIQGDA
jgi:UDP-glucose 4-epimerase